MRGILVIVLLQTVSVLFAQDLVCGTTPDASTIQALSRLRYVNHRAASNQTYNIAITAHIVRRSNGNGGLGVDDLMDAIDDMNDSFSGSGLSFYLEGDVNYVDNDDFFNFDSSQEPDITSANNVSNTINIYFYNSLSSGESALCGYAYFPETGRDHIMMANSCTVGGSTLAHEVGHYLALYHTHGKTNNGTTDELVDGTNCDVAGDDVCDTPADPNLSGVVNVNFCGYIGSGSDENGDFFIPDARNLMSYSNSDCRVLFTDGQKQRMLNAYLEYKTYLNTRDLIANFDFETREACTSVSTTYTNDSKGADSYLWEFEGATPATSTDANPSVTYSTPGVYTVKLTAYSGAEESVKIDSLTVVNIAASSGETLEGSFEEETLPTRSLNVDNDVTWEITEEASFDGDKAMKVNLYKYNNIDEMDYLVFPSVSTSASKYFELRFYYAYSGFNATYNDGLEMVYRSDCGDWVSIWEKVGSDLQSAEYEQREFIAKSDEWQLAKAEFTVAADVDEIEVAIRSKNGFGNAIYVDLYKLAPNDPAFNISAIDKVDVTCPEETNGSIAVTVEGTGDFVYSLNDGEFGTSNTFADLTEGTYELNVKNLDTDITESELVFIETQSVYPTQPSLTLNDSRLIANASLLPGQTLVWYLDGEVIENPSTTLEDPVSGSYQVAVSNGICESLSDPILIQVLGADDIISGLSVYPNPIIGDNIKIESDQDAPIRLFSLSGELVLTFDYNREGDYSIPRVANGIYLIRQGNYSEKIIIDRK